MAEHFCNSIGVLQQNAAPSKFQQPEKQGKLYQTRAMAGLGLQPSSPSYHWYQNPMVLQATAYWPITTVIGILCVCSVGLMSHGTSGLSFQWDVFL